MDADVLPAHLAPDGERAGDLPILATDSEPIANIGNGHGTPADVPVLAHDTASTGTDDEVPGDVPLVAQGSTSTGSHETSVDVPLTPDDAPARAGASEISLTDTRGISAVRLVAPDEPEPVEDVRLVAQASDEEDMAGAVSASQLAHRRWRWERKKHGATWYYLLTTGRYYAKGNDTREYIYIGKEKGDPAGRARRAGVSLPHG